MSSCIGRYYDHERRYCTTVQLEHRLIAIRSNQCVCSIYIVSYKLWNYFRVGMFDAIVSHRLKSI